MATTQGGSTDSSTSGNQAAEQFQQALSSGDAAVTQGILNLQRVHQARLAGAKRALATLTAQYGADDARVKTAAASISARNTTIAQIALARQQTAAPTVEASKTGWALHGWVLHDGLTPAARFTVFLVDAKKSFQEQYGFAYTDQSGYFLINFAGATGSAGTPQLFVEVADTKANPVYLSTTAFQPVPGSTTIQNIVLPAGGQPIGDPPEAIRKIALPQHGGEPTEKESTG